MYSDFTKSVFGIFREGGNTVFQQGAGQTGLFIIRQPGGVVGTDQGELSSDGSDFIIENKAGGSTRFKNTSNARTIFSGISGANLYFESDGIVLSMFSPNGTGLISFAPGFSSNADKGFIATRYYASSGSTNSDLSFSREAAGEWAVGDALAGKALLLGASGLVRGKAVASSSTASRSRASNIATMVTQAAHNLVAGQIVTVSGMTDATFNATALVATVVSTTSFTYANAGGDEGSAADTGGTVTPKAVLQLGTAPTTADATADVIIGASAATQTPLILQGAAGQSVPALEIQESDGTVAFSLSLGANGDNINLTTQGIVNTVGFNYLGIEVRNDGGYYFSNTTNADLYVAAPDAGIYRYTSAVVNCGVSGGANGSFRAVSYFGATAGSLAAPNLAGYPATGTDATPLSVVVGGGLGTGAGAGGSVTIATPTTLGTGTTAQTRVARITVSQGAVTTDIATARFAPGVETIFTTSYTDASNYEQFKISSTAGTITLAAETAGTGTDNVDIVLTPAGAGQIRQGVAPTTADALATVMVGMASGTRRGLVVQSKAGAGVFDYPFVVSNSAGTPIHYVQNVDGGVNPNYVIASNGGFVCTTMDLSQNSSACVGLQDAGVIRWANAAPNFVTTSPTWDTGLERFAAGIVGVTDGSTGVGSLYTAGVDTVTGTNASGVEGVKVSPTATGGLQTVVVDKTVSPSAVETAVFTVPAGSVIRLVQGNVQSALTGGGTTVTWSLGTAGDPDKYGTAGSPTAADSLAQNSKDNWIPIPAQLTSAEPIVLTGTATGGATDGDTALTVGSVRVVIVYDTYEALANA